MLTENGIPYFKTICQINILCLFKGKCKYERVFSYSPLQTLFIITASKNI